MKKFAFGACFLLLFAYTSHTQNTIITDNDTWKYLDNGTNQGTAWRTVSFVDNTWKTGIGKFGYGISNANTIISYGPNRNNKHVTTYFRKTISISNPAAVATYLARIKRDDGAVVYLNGAEVYRSNMPAGSISYTTLASVGASDNGATGQQFTISSALFVPGTNVIAVEIHQRWTSFWEFDMAFDLSLESVNEISPAVISINRQSPATNSTNATSVTFRATFSEAVNGVGTTDFSPVVISGSVSGVVSTVSSISGSVYDVTISSISGDGVLRLDLKATGTGITDLAGNAIGAGFTTGQTYTIDQSAPTLTSVSIISNNSTPSRAKPGNLVSLSFTASEPINTPVVTIATHAVAATAGTGNSFTATYTMTVSDASGVVPFTIDFTNTTGTAGTRVTATTNGSSVTFDKTPPTVTSINRQSPSTSPTNATSVTFRATFAEAVNGVNTPDFVLTVTSGAVNGVLSTVSSINASVYDVTVSSITGNGSLRLDLKASGTGITDVAGNAIAIGFTTGQTYIIDQNTSNPGFSSIVRLNSINISSTTQHKPQAKAWNYANKWWCVLSTATNGTQIFRLDGTTWTSVLILTSNTGKLDCFVAGDLVHILGLKESSASFMYTVEYDPALGKYKLWHLRPANSPLTFGSGAEVATLTVDGTGRLWVASTGVTALNVWWSDAPYSTWSAPIAIASGLLDDDICAITPIPTLGKIGVFWSNQSTKLFGFKTHTDGASPGTWSADELPASQYAIPNIGMGFADDHMNIKVASDGTLYCSAKTGYDTDQYQRLVLLVRRPAGTWDNAYTVTNVYPEGTQPMVMLNETQNKLRVIYTSLEVGGNILYRESPTSNISFGPAMTLISDAGKSYNYATSTHQNCNSEVVIIATYLNSSQPQAVSVLASDGSSSSQSSAISLAAKSELPQLFSTETTETVIQAYPNPFASGTNVKFTLSYSAAYELILYDGKGIKRSIIKRGWAEAGVSYTAILDGAALASGLYFISLQSDRSSQVIKVLVQK